MVAQPDRVGGGSEGGMVCLNIAPPTAAIGRLPCPQLLFLSLVGVWSLPPSREERTWTTPSIPGDPCSGAHGVIRPLFAMYVVSPNSQKSHPRGPVRDGKVRHAAWESPREHNAAGSGQLPAPRHPPRLPSYRKQMLNFAMPIFELPILPSSLSRRSSSRCLEREAGWGTLYCVGS